MPRADSPFVNPDGFDFTWTDDRLWRKNRRNNGNSYGVDLNRNYDDHWGGPGASDVPSSDTYRGPSAASEPEVQALTAFFLENTNIVGARRAYRLVLLHFCAVLIVARRQARSTFTATAS